MPATLYPKARWRGCALLTGALVAGTVGGGGLGGGGLAEAAAGATVAGPARPSASCSAPKIVSFSFKPRAVTEGKLTTLSWAIRNCTGRSFSGSFETFGMIACETVDPIDQGLNIASGATVRGHEAYVAPDCTGRGQITGRLMAHDGKILATRVAKLTVVAGKS